MHKNLWKFFFEEAFLHQTEQRSKLWQRTITRDFKKLGINAYPLSGLNRLKDYQVNPEEYTANKLFAMLQRAGWKIVNPTRRVLEKYITPENRFVIQVHEWTSLSRPYKTWKEINKDEESKSTRKGKYSYDMDLKQGKEDDPYNRPGYDYLSTDRSTENKYVAVLELTQRTNIRRRTQEDEKMLKDAGLDKEYQQKKLVTKPK